MGTYFTSTGERLTQSQLDRKIRKAKREKLDAMFEQHGYHFCEDCGTNQDYLDCSHNVSVQRAKNNRQTELCYDIENITIRCRKCHQKYDKLNVQW